jgi:multidrug efflux pump
VFSQVLTLYTTPVIYLAFDRLAKRVSKRRGGSSVSHPSPVEAA